MKIRLFASFLSVVLASTIIVGGTTLTRAVADPAPTPPFETDDSREDMSGWLLRAEQGSSDAQFYVGSTYYLGTDVPKNLEKAVQWFLRSAEQGNPRAQYNMGVAYYSALGVAHNDASALAWWKRAAANQSA